MSQIKLQRAQELIKSFRSVKTIILGDLMLDKYLWGQVDRISPEAPVPVVAVKKDSSCLGGAGNVYHNLETLGTNPLLAGVVGKDNAGAWIAQRVSDSRGILSLADRQTTIKTRIIAHQQQVVRVDQENGGAISPESQAELTAFIRQVECSGLFISDYNKGLISKPLMDGILSLCQSKKIPVFVDPKVENISLYSPVTLLTPNHHEAGRIVNLPCFTDTEVESAGKKILARLDAKYLIIKRGEQGMTVFERQQPAFHIPTVAHEVFDVTGAGDTVIAVAGLALLSGATLREAAHLANAAAGVVVGKIGTATIAPEELLQALGQ